MSNESVRHVAELTETELALVAADGFWVYCAMSATGGAAMGGAAGALLGPGALIGAAVGALAAGAAAAIGYEMFGC